MPVGERLVWLLCIGVVEGVDGREEAREGLGGKVQVNRGRQI